MIVTRTADHQFGQPHRYRSRSQRGLVALYGSTGVRDSWFALDRAFGYLTPSARPMASMDMATKWANDSFLTDMAALDTAAVAAGETDGRFAPFAYHMLGASMGGLSSCIWAIQNPEKVKSIQLLIPAINPIDIHTNNRSGFAAEVAAAHGGGAPPASRSAASDENMEALAAFPIKVYYSTTDGVTPLSIMEAFIEGVTDAGGSVETVNMGAQGHFWNGDFNGTAVADFIELHD